MYVALTVFAQLSKSYVETKDTHLTLGDIALSGVSGAQRDGCCACREETGSCQRQEAEQRGT